jgi:beta-xylosidase
VIEAVMLWNEPNNLSHWNRDLDPEWRLFGEMTCLAGERLAKVAPGVQRALGGLAPMDPWFVRNLFAQGVSQAVDVIAVHGFPLDWNRWHYEEWPQRLEAIREATEGKPVWATEVGVSSFASESLQAWGLDQTAEMLLPHVERAYWYSLLDLPERWEAQTRHRDSEGSSYFRHFRMGVYDAAGRPKLAAERLRAWARTGLGACEWVYWQEPERLEMFVTRLEALGITRLRTGIGWADWLRPGALEWFDHVMERLAAFELTVTLCFTPAALGIQPNHASPPRELTAFADFCEEVLCRYGPAAGVAAVGKEALACTS